MTRDDARLAEISRLSDAARALAEAQDAREIAGPDDADVPTATDFRDAAAVIALLIGLGWALKAWWPL